jgi:hypothetical protein
MATAGGLLTNTPILTRTSEDRCVTARISLSQIKETATPRPQQSGTCPAENTRESALLVDCAFWRWWA